MRISFSILLFFAAVLPFLHAAEKTTPQDETDAIAASVNGDPISVRDLLAESARQMVTGYFVSIAMNRKAPPYPASAEKRIAGSCIDEKLLQQLGGE